MSGMEIGQAVLLVAFIIFLWPNAKRWLKDGPKAEKGDWTAVALPIVGVILFVMLLMEMVS